MVYLEDISLSHEEFHINGTPLLAAIKSRLWFLIQSKLSSYLASQKLKPFVASKTMHRVSSGSYEMLDEAFEDGEDAMEVDNQLFESPLGDLEQNLFGEEEAGFHGGEYKDLFWEELDIGEEVLDTCFEQNFGHDDDLLDDGEEGNQPITYGSSRPAKLFGKVSSLE